MVNTSPCYFQMSRPNTNIPIKVRIQWWCGTGNVSGTAGLG